MANLYFYLPNDMFHPSFLIGYVTSYSRDQITINDYQGTVATYYGRFTFSDDGLSGGTVTGYKQWEFGRLSYEVTGTSVSAITLSNFYDAFSQQAYVLSGNDSIIGSSFGVTFGLGKVEMK